MPAPDRDALDAAIIAAHDRGDPARLSELYQKAATALEAAGDTDAACFFLTHAYVFALEAGLDDADRLRTILQDRGRI